MLHNILSKTNKEELINLLLGAFILAVGINLFIAPHNLAFGGVTGMTIIIQSLTGLPIFISNLLLSVIVILIGWFELGYEFMIKTIIPTLILPVFLFLTAPLSRTTTNLSSSAIIGAITIGFGISLTMFAGGSTAGPDTIGLILKKRFRIPVTLTMIIIDTLVIACGYRVYGIKTAIWSIGVAILMNITVKLSRDFLSKEIIFRNWRKYMHKSEVVSKK